MGILTTVRSDSSRIFSVMKYFPFGRAGMAWVLLLVLVQRPAPAQEGASPEAESVDGNGYRSWSAYGGDAGQTRYSSLDQINRSNVGRLERAWTFDTGDDGPTIECNPIVVDGVMYLTSPALTVIALDAASGTEIWRFAPLGADYDGPEYWRYVSRGLTYWTDGIASRIFSAAGPFVNALDAGTGDRIPDFGRNGRIDLREGLGTEEGEPFVQATSPGIIHEGLIIFGTNVSESPGAAPGHIRAYSVQTGQSVWTFSTIPKPDETGHETWEGTSAAAAGGANPWSGLSLDRRRGILFAATGAATYDFYGGNRKGENLFANTVLALDAASGERIWHYQIVRHDLWDYDLPSPPTLVRIRVDGQPIDALAQITKHGFVFVLDRESGEPIFSVEERPVPISDVPGEQAWPVQRVPTKPPPFARQHVTEEDLTDRTPQATRYARELYAGLRSEGLFTPGSTYGTLMLPGFLGGGNWSGAAFDPTTGWLYVSANNFPSIVRLEESPDSLRALPGYPRYRAAGYAHFVDEEGYPAIKPPWGTLSAIDLNEGEMVWQVPLGTYPALADRGLPPTGTLNLGGAIVTAGGLVFIGSTMDRKFRAFDKASGDVLWEADLPTGGMALPATYELEGRQYVVIAAGGGVGMRGARPIETPPGRTYVAFSLP